AKACGVPRTRIVRIVRIVCEELGISGDTAVRLGKFFKASPEFWRNLQARYEVLTAQSKAADALARIEPYEPRAA
ncbi:MAG TPA: addiction module antidote protein, HigA family, partial [Methylocystis sp.]|nr:addiction module antidote protein, HigA family [Methylocystis sp.]